jgi:hypothetical protein
LHFFDTYDFSCCRPNPSFFRQNQVGRTRPKKDPKKPKTRKCHFLHTKAKVVH